MLYIIYYHTYDFDTWDARGEPTLIETHSTYFGGLEVVVTVYCEYAPGRSVYPFTIAIPRLSERDLEDCSDPALAERLRSHCAILEIEVEEDQRWEVHTCSLIRASCPADYIPLLCPCTIWEGDDERQHEPVYFTGRSHGGDSPTNQSH